MAPVRENITGEVSYLVDRLHVSRVSLWLMVVGFILLVLVTIIVWFSTASRVVSRDPGSIGAVAAILSQSTGLYDLLHIVRADSDDELKRGLGSQSFRTIVSEKEGIPAFHISMSSMNTGLDAAKPKEMSTSRDPTWLPLTLELPVMIATFFLPLAVIAILQILQNLSDQHEGILAITHGAEIYARYVPVIFMLLVATLFNALDFNVATLCVFSGLYRGTRAGKHSMCSNLLGKLAPHALFNAIREHHLGAAMTSIASLVGSVLTIVVSGLYVIQETRTPTGSRQLERLGTFNLTWNNSAATDHHAALVLSLVDNLNLSYPRFTHSEIALPEFVLGKWLSPVQTDLRISGSTFIKLPALRGNLNCTMVPRSRLHVWTDRSGYFFGRSPDRAAYVNASIDLPKECQQKIVNYRPSWSTFNNSFKFPATDYMYAGAQISLNYGAGYANVTWPDNYFPHEVAGIADNPPGCPSLAFTFGRFKWDSTDSSNVTAMYCFQEIQELQATVSLLPNSTELDLSQPPVVDEQTVRTLQNGNSGSTAFQYRIQSNLASVLVAPYKDQLDGFFNALVNSSNAFTPESFTGAGNEQKLFDRINGYYRRYMAQAINANMRVACANITGSCDGIIGSANINTRRQSTSANSGLGSMTVYATKPRLRQDKTTKLILQVMLGIMTICGMIAIWSTKMRKLLPYNPYSIAGVMGLLAGSEVCGSHSGIIPPGAEWMNDHDLRGIFATHTYSLGWWRTGDSSSDYDTMRDQGIEGTHDDRYERYGIDVGLRPTGQNGVISKPTSRRSNSNGRWRMPELRWRSGYHRPSSPPNLEVSQPR